jgi:hypothetical protein
MATPQTTTAGVQSQFPINQVVDDPPPDEPVVSDDVGAPEPDNDAGSGEAERNAQEESAAAEMRQHGWVDRDEWTAQGKDPARWRPASEFKEYRTQLASVVRQENSQLRAKLAAMEQREQAREQREAEARERITSDTLRSELKIARENQDYDKADEILDKLLDQKVAKVAAPKPPAIDPAVVESANRFKAANTWVETDRTLGSNFALELKSIVDMRLTDSFDDALKLAKERVQRLYPERFKTRPNGSRVAMADTGGTTGSPVHGRTWSDLKENYRRMADRDIADKKYTRDEYLAFAAEDPNEYFRG